ncbi:MAG: sporulation protein YqfD [Oscillospiraceae bacterium]|nr:sporulation protein YqfD [Oscillospiraceae bacterium]
MKAVYYSPVSGTVKLNITSSDGCDRSADLITRLTNTVRYSGLTADQGVITLYTDRQSLKRIILIAEELEMSVSITEKKGLYFLFSRYSARTGILIGTLLALAVIIFLSNIVLRIEVYGNETISEKQILSILKDNGITYGTFIPSVDLRRAEISLQTSSDKLAWAGVRRMGFRIIAEVSEATEKPPMISKERPCNIIADRDAQITSISVQSGMLIPMKGDTVRKGELLISGVVAKEFRGAYYVHAIGEIKGKYREEITVTQKLTDYITVYDEPFTNRQLNIFGMTIPLKGSRQLTGKYELSAYTDHIQMFTLTLPISVTYTEVMPYHKETVSYTEEQALEIAEEKLTAYENNILTDNHAVILERELTANTDENSVILTADYILEGSIGRQSPIYFDVPSDSSADLKD